MLPESVQFNERAGVAVTVLTPSLGIFCLNLSWDNSHPHRGFTCFYSGLRSKCRDNTAIRLLPLPYKSFPIHRPSVILPLHVIKSSYWERGNITSTQSISLWREHGNGTDWYTSCAVSHKCGYRTPQGHKAGCSLIVCFLLNDCAQHLPMLCNREPKIQPVKPANKHWLRI
jgi:hypothetical protein